MGPEVIANDVEALLAELTKRVRESISRALVARGRAAVAVTGGSVATTLLPKLGRLEVDWSSVHVFWGDERAVPYSDPESNYGAAHAFFPSAALHPMPADSDDLERAARAYETELTGLFGAPPRLDVAILGVGPDGHVCSLFPGHALLSESVRFVAPITDAPKPPPRRITLTLPALIATRLVIIAALGAAKAEVAREAIENTRSELPAALVTQRAPRVLWLLDRPAARALSR